MVNIKETAYNHLSDTGQIETHGTFCTSERKWIGRIKKYAESHPDDVKIRTENEDGSIVAIVPKTWFKLSPPVKMNLSDEYRETLRESCARARAAKVAMEMDTGFTPTN